MPAAVDSPKTAPAEPAAETAGSAPIVIDLGKRRRKQIKQLREGRGKLMDDVGGVIEELRKAGAIGESAQPVVIVVREKPKNPLTWPFG
jgi:Family of unknown function (DUF6200)